MATEDFTPTVEEVAAYLRTRTKTEFSEADTFTEDTRPTADQVTTLIEEAVQEVATSVGDLNSELPCAETLRFRAKGAVVLYACMLIELSYFPEQVGTRSVFDSFEKLYDKRIKVLVEAVEDCLGGSGDSAGGDGSSGMPVNSFPCDPIIGRETEW